MREARAGRISALSLGVIVACALLAWPAPGVAGAGPQDAQEPASSPRQAEAFRPPQAISVVNTNYPMTTNAGGIVVLDVSLDGQGKLQGTRPLRDIPPLTSVAASALRDWKFQPAAAHGAAQPSTLTAVFVFRPPVSIWEPPPFRPVLHVARSSGYVPPDILSAAWAQYPLRSVAAGSVVVQVTVDEAGYVVGSQVLRGIKGFTQLALDAAQQWRFRPATLDGAPVRSRVAIVFVFANPLLNPRPSFRR